MDKKVFNEIRELVYKTAGIKLSEQKEALVSARIGKRMRSLGLNKFEEYISFVKGDKDANEIIYMIDAISTNVTSFFRESNHFEFLQRQMHEWLNAGNRRFRVWCAASSSGEEPYTIAITLNEVLGNVNVDWKILATDISVSVLQKCIEGVYSGDRLKGLTTTHLQKYFTKMTGEEKSYQVKDSLKKRILFRQLNLNTPPFSLKGPLDVIFIRNVMIYFDGPVKERLIAEAYRLLKPGGFLIVGHAESLNGVKNSFTPVKPSIYMKK